LESLAAAAWPAVEAEAELPLAVDFFFNEDGRPVATAGFLPAGADEGRVDVAVAGCLNSFFTMMDVGGASW
jgi:hypothetical protein